MKQYQVIKKTLSASSAVRQKLALSAEVLRATRHLRKVFAEWRAKVFLRQLVTAVEYMHRAGIAHRDIKAENVLIGRDGKSVKLIDFGSSRDLLNPKVEGSGTFTFKWTFKNYVGTPNFMAPEAIGNSENDCVSDVWSLGCTFFQVLQGIPPFSAGSEYLVLLRSKSIDLLFHPSVSAEAEELIKAMVVEDRTKRIRMDDVKRHKFFDSVDVDYLPNYSMSEVIVKQIAQTVKNEDFHCALPFDEKWVASSTLSTRTKLMMSRVLMIRDWELRSRQGSGVAMLEHLNLPELKDDYEWLRQNRSTLTKE
jgi:serine/threonine protein kinase